MPTPNPTSTSPRGTLALLRELVPHRSLHRTEALRIAELQASRLRQHLNISRPAFPLQTIVDLPRVEIRHEPNLAASGMTFWNGSTWVIVIDPTEAENRRRFSILHEFKHIIDHPQTGRLYGSTPGTRSTAAEQSADYFAACLLMPKMLVKRHWGRHPNDTIGLARLFRVSPAAMKYRLDSLGLTDHEPRCRWSAPTALPSARPAIYSTWSADT